MRAHSGKAADGYGEVVVTATPDTIVVTDETTRAELAEAITHLGAYAARQMHHPDCERWVTAHRRIDNLLYEWQRASA